jgi:acetaldehyde dehydrogenase / alcohol dehydrogenase
VKPEVAEILFKAKTAAAIFSQYDQQHVDRIINAVYRVAFDNRIKLAEMAVEETGLGRFEDKVMKNVIASQMVYYSIKNQKTVGIISEDEEKGIIEIAQPLGPIFAIIPITNPTSTAIYKILISLKTRNPIIVHPHRRAAKCTIEAAKLCYEAALSEDAPDDCIQWVTGFSREDTQQVMSHNHVALILATGGSGLVRAAYSSGTPAIGVGAGNVPVFIEESADIDYAIEQILMSKLFDNGTICASEQAVVIQKGLKDKVIESFIDHGAYMMNNEEIEKVSKVAYDRERKGMNGDIVGKSAQFIADLAGINVPKDTKLLIAQLHEVGDNAPLSSEILAPILALYIEDDFDKAVNRCIDLNFYGGVGHTASIYSNNDEIIRKFSFLMNAGRIVVNMPSSQGAVGITSKLAPSLTLGCGTGGKNITTDNISAKHLLNIQRIARRRDDNLFVRFDKNNYLDKNYTAEMLDQEFYRNI